jgi:hypothetical protein
MANEPCFDTGLKYVAAPPVQPHRFGLFSTALFVPDSDPHWQLGVQWEGVACEAADAYGHCNCILSGESAPDPKTYREGTPLTVATPFTVYGSFKCSPIGRWDDAYKRAEDHLLAGEERAVEAEIALGAIHTSAFLTDANSVDITPTPGTPVSVTQGVALLEEYLGANHHSTGVIVGNRRDILLAVAADAVCCPKNTDTALYSGLGTPVAALAGFDGRTGPNADPAGTNEAWLFGMGRPIIRRSEVFFTPPNRNQALSQRTNDFEVLAERTYAVGWECVTAAVLITSVGS